MYKNGEGYDDPTAGAAIRNIMLEESRLKRIAKREIDETQGFIGGEAYVRAKDYLNRLYYLQNKVEVLTEEIEKLDSLSRKVTGAYGGERVSHSAKSDTMENAIVKLVDLKKQLEEELAGLIEVQADIRDTISAVNNPAYRSLLEMRYINIWHWDRICSALGVGRTQAFKLHGKALIVIDGILQKKTKRSKNGESV